MAIEFKDGKYVDPVTGRVTLDPRAHLDPAGSLMLLVAGLGWAKPVPIDQGNFRRPKLGMALTALAGPLANILLALALHHAVEALGQIWSNFRRTPREAA